MAGTTPETKARTAMSPDYLEQLCGQIGHAFMVELREDSAIFAIIAAILQHVLGVLKHHIIDRNTTLHRMLKPE